jgi:hypothetical protein
MNVPNAEETMLAEIANWAVGTKLDFVITKCATLGFYRCQVHERDGGFRVLLELIPAEAAIFDRHISFPARKADLADLPQRLRIAKLRLLQD